jgi:hypothetical protein
MLTIYDPAEPRPLLLTARREWGSNHYELRSVELAGRPATELVFRRGDEARAMVQSCLWLPWTALDKVGGLSVDLHCTNSGAKLFLDCLDADGWGLRFFLGTDQYAGWHTFRFDPFELAATWGACAGKRSSTDPLQPVALMIEDHADRGSFELGLGQVVAQAQPAEPLALHGEAACNLDRSTLELDITRGARLLRNFGLRAMLPGPGQADFRRLSVRNVKPLAHGLYQAELASGEVRLPLEVELQQISSQVWIVRYELHFRTALRLDELHLRGLLGYREAVGLSFVAGDDEAAELDGRPSAEPVLAEPAIWESLSIGVPGEPLLRIKADAPVLKSLQLLDLRAEEDTPSYAVEVIVARDEEFAAGTELKFNMLFDGNG